MIFGIDIDDVVADFMPAYARKISEKHGISVTIDDINTWAFYPSIGLENKYIKEDLDAFSREGIYRDLDPIPHAVNSLLHLTNNHTVYFITSRAVEVQEDTEHWFKLYLPFVDPDTIHYVKNKGAVVKKLEVTHFVDDRVENVISALINGADNGVLFSNAHNRGTAVDGIPRVDSWTELMREWKLPLDFMAPCADVCTTPEDIIGKTEDKSM